MGTHQGDPWGGALFALAHFRALHSTINHFPFCLFPSIADDIHIIGPISIISFAYEHFQTKLHAIGLLSNLKTVLHGHLLACHQTSTPHPSLPHPIPRN